MTRTTTPTMPKRLCDQREQAAEANATAKAAAAEAAAAACQCGRRPNCCFRRSSPKPPWPPSSCASPKCSNISDGCKRQLRATSGKPDRRDRHAALKAKSHSLPVRRRASASPSPRRLPPRAQADDQRLRRPGGDRGRMRSELGRDRTTAPIMSDPQRRSSGWCATAPTSSGRPTSSSTMPASSTSSPVEDFPLEKWDAILAINLSAVFHTTRLALPAMKAKTGAGSSTPRPRTASSPRPTSRPMSPPSTASPASPRRSRSRRRKRRRDRQLHLARLCLDDRSSRTRFRTR